MVKVSIIIPFRNEKWYAVKTVQTVYNYFQKTKLNFEIIAVDDSTDETWDILKNLEKKYKRFRAVQGWKPPGYGKALRKGFQLAKGDIIVPYHGDMCDSLDDVMKYIKIIDSGYDMALGSRYEKGSRVINYPRAKGIFSAIGNLFLRTIFLTRCSDLTNNFKGFSKRVLKTINPVSDSFEIGLEMALRGMKKGLKYRVIPISWIDRESGMSKMNVKKTMIRHFVTAMKIFFGVGRFA